MISTSGFDPMVVGSNLSQALMDICIRKIDVLFIFISCSKRYRKTERGDRIYRISVSHSRLYLYQKRNSKNAKPCDPI